MQLSQWIGAFRPKTLSAAVVPVMVGSGLVFAQGQGIEIWISILALLAALFIQIGTNLINDAIDFKKGADTESRVGPKRITQSGGATSKQVMGLGYASLLLAFLCGIPLVIQGGWVIMLVGLTSLFLAYAYTGGPFPLAYKGLGDLFVILFFGLISVGGIYYLHTKTFSLAVFVAGLQVGLLATVMIAINNLRDVEGDAKVDKKTLAVRFGKNFVKGEIVFLIALSFLLLFYWIQQGQYLVGILPFLAGPLALTILKGVRKALNSSLNAHLAQAAGLHMLFGLQMTIGFLLVGIV